MSDNHSIVLEKYIFVLEKSLNFISEKKKVWEPRKWVWEMTPLLAIETSCEVQTRWKVSTILASKILNHFLSAATQYSAIEKAVSTSWASCQIRKIASCACAGNAGNIFPRHRGVAIRT